MIVVTGDLHTKLLLHGNSFIDGSKDKRAITNTGVAVSTAQSKFVDSSFYFDGSAYLTIPGYDFSTDDFTIDWWEYPTNANAGTRFTNVYCTAYATQAGGLLTHLCTSGLQVYLSNKTGGATAADWNVLAGKTLGNNIVNTWTHRAVVRSGSSLMFFKNGLLEYTYDIGTNKIGYSSDRPWGIGNWASDLMTTGYPYIGYIDEFRVSDIARWTESFTPPTEPYPDSNIEILPGGVISKEWALRRRLMLKKKATEYLVTITGVGWHEWYEGNVYTMATVTINGTAYNAAPPEPIQVDEGDIIKLQVYRGSLYGAAHIIIDGTTVVDGAGVYDYKVQSNVTINLSKQAYTVNDYGGQISLTTV